MINNYDYTKQEVVTIELNNYFHFMKMSRPSRIIAACIMLWSLLFMQLSLAAYTCPGSAAMNSIEMTGCTGMDKDQPALCHTHAQDPLSKQSLDQPQLPDVPSFFSSGIIILVNFADEAIVPSSSLNASTSLGFLCRSTAPPITIRHCCFRI
ncbi:hypothetical protein ACO0K3_03025 [Undibacterium sp. Rencai35W]|uniref:hypothetical protein n=1 Tax=Undibacterium sp. Rencai35W TaxID=3413046 RepID=UPI003BF08F18